MPVLKRRDCIALHGRNAKAGFREVLVCTTVIALRTTLAAATVIKVKPVSQSILFRGASLEVVWPRMLALAAIGTVFFLVARTRFRKSIGQMA